MADIRVRHRELRPIEVSASEIPGLIDELPLVAILAAFARGVSSVRGARELRVKESDRIAAIAAAFQAIGGTIEEHEDGWNIVGSGRLRGGSVETRGDHRIAMAFLVAGLRATDGITVDDASAAAVSDPGFLPRLRKLSK